MIEVERAVDGLRLVGCARDEDLARAGEALARELPLGESALCERRQVAGLDVWLKSEPMKPRVARRLALRARLLGRPYPRLAEYANLRWLREHGFGAPEPLLALVGLRAGHGCWQLLVTRAVPKARNLRSVLETRTGPVDELLEVLGRSVAGLHAAGFVHRDLYPRNLLVHEGSDVPEIVFLDAWRGGARPQLRGPAYDLACLFLHTPLWLEGNEAARLVEAYLAERTRLGSPVDGRRLVRRLERGRRGLIRRLVAEPGRSRGLSLPDEAWQVGWRDPA
jgi:tRNA A-37 threonylcarbamoyl transferase component Bud32